MANADTSYECRLLRHAWKRFEPTEPYNSVYRNVLHLQCLRCPTIRHDEFDTTGGLAKRKYDYPDDYRLNEDERPTTEQLRLWYLKRARLTAKRRSREGELQPV